MKTKAQPAARNSAHRMVRHGILKERQLAKIALEISRYLQATGATEFFVNQRGSWGRRWPGSPRRSS
jgi:hypothetical protein